MKPHLNLIAMVAAAALLSACDTVPHARLYNGTGVPLDLAVKIRGDEKPKTLEPGAAVHVTGLFWRGIGLSVGGCEFRYVLPYMALNAPWPRRAPDGAYLDGGDFSYPVKVQIAPDFTLFLMPNKAKSILSTAALQAGQANGFPLVPVGKTCP